MATADDYLKLALASGLGPLTFKKLLASLGSVEGILAAPLERLRAVEGVGEKLAREIVRVRTAEELAMEQALIQARGVQLVTWAAAAYPQRLKAIFAPPPLLYCQGGLKPEDRLSLAIVGSRQCSYYGRSQAERLARELAALGFSIVSGLARGIDSAAHQAALSAGGRTIAVLGNGLSSIFPPENAELAEKIAASGALLSEFPMATPPLRENFHRRNRIISGLSLGVVVVEGTERSGALITASHALEQGREVFAVPGKIDTYLSRGPHLLIKQGAKLVESVSDILEELGPLEGVLRGEPPPLKEEGAKIPLNLTRHEEQLYGLLGSEPVSIEELIGQSELSPQEVSANLMLLEIKRLCRQMPGKRFVRA